MSLLVIKSNQFRTNLYPITSHTPWNTALANYGTICSYDTIAQVMAHPSYLHREVQLSIIELDIKLIRYLQFISQARFFLIRGEFALDTC